MKKVLLSLVLALSFITGSMAQSLSLSNNGHGVSNGDTITVAGDVATTLVCQVNVTNNAGSALSVKCKRTNISVVPGSTNSFCWGGSCWDTSYYISPDPTVIAAGATSTEFSGDYKANGHSGISLVRYRFYDMNAVSDSICFFGKFVATVGINETSLLSVGDIYPNPADNAAFVNYSIQTGYGNAEVKVMDLLGNKVQLIPIYDNEGKIKINTESLNSGVYFYSIVIDGKPMFTKKLIVKHK